MTRENNMKRLEIISLRTSGEVEQQARKSMRKFCRIVKKHHLSDANFSLSDANFYVHASIPNDLALVISSQVQEGKDMRTDLGCYMADLLKQFGIVDYNCWLMIEET